MEKQIEGFREIIARCLNVDVSSVRVDSRLVEDLGADSIGLLAVEQELRNAYNAEISKLDLQRLETVGQYYTFFCKRPSRDSQ